MRRGTIILFDGELWRVHEVEHQTPGNLRARVQTKLKSLRTGAMKDQRFRSEDEVEKAHFETKDMQYLYADGKDYHFMDTRTYEQVQLHEDVLGDLVYYLAPETMVTVDLFEGHPVGIELPSAVDLRVVETAPEVKGATAAAQRKPAKLETGLMVQVPSFIGTGERIRVSTEDGSYLERVK
jgi:elongation factor P